MNLWATLGLTPVAGAWVAAGGVAVALVLAVLLLSRRARRDAPAGLGLDNYRRR